MLDRDTGGTETSKYLEEKKSIEILIVAASEMRTAQTFRLWRRGLWDHNVISKDLFEVCWKARP